MPSQCLAQPTNKGRTSAPLQVSRTQFVRVCSIALWNTPDDVLDAACTAYKNAVVTAKNCSEHYWTNLAQANASR